MVIDNILEINLTKRQNIKNGFIHFLVVLSNPLRCRKDKLQGLSSTESQISENHGFFVVHNGYRALLTHVLMPIKQYAVFRCSKYWFKQFYKIPSWHFTHKTSQERHRTHTSYADTDVLQTLCADSALRHPYIDFEIKHIRHLIKIPFINKVI